MEGKQGIGFTSSLRGYSVVSGATPIWDEKKLVDPLEDDHKQRLGYLPSPSPPKEPLIETLDGRWVRNGTEIVNN